jgi:hypothetical protein
VVRRNKEGQAGAAGAGTAGRSPREKAPAARGGPGVAIPDARGKRISTRAMGEGAKRAGSHRRGRDADHAPQTPPDALSYFPVDTPPSVPPALSGPVDGRPTLSSLRNPSAKNAGRLPDGTVKKHKPDTYTRERVKKYVAFGASENEIAVLLDIRPGQLRTYYARELSVGALENHMKVGSAILTGALKGNDKLAIFWAKARMGWKDGNVGPGDKEVPPLNIHIHS